jgi:hypothetical protein
MISVIVLPRLAQSLGGQPRTRAVKRYAVWAISSFFRIWKGSKREVTESVTINQTQFGRY